MNGALILSPPPPFRPHPLHTQGKKTQKNSPNIFVLKKVMLAELVNMIIVCVYPSVSFFVLHTSYVIIVYELLALHSCKTTRAEYSVNFGL